MYLGPVMLARSCTLGGTDLLERVRCLCGPLLAVRPAFGLSGLEASFAASFRLRGAGML